MTVALLGVLLAPGLRPLHPDLRAQSRRAASLRRGGRGRLDHPPRDAMRIPAHAGAGAGSLATLASPDDDDASLRKGKRRASRERSDAALSSRPQARPGGDFLSMLRKRIATRCRPRPGGPALLPHFGSGPCHAIPRPRESTIPAPFQSADLLA